MASSLLAGGGPGGGPYDCAWYDWPYGLGLEYPVLYPPPDAYGLDWSIGIALGIATLCAASRLLRFRAAKIEKRAIRMTTAAAMATPIPMREP